MHCPYCGTLNKNSASVCRNCSSDIQKEARFVGRIKYERFYGVVIFLMAVIILSLLDPWNLQQYGKDLSYLQVLTLMFDGEHWFISLFFIFVIFVFLGFIIRKSILYLRSLRYKEYPICPKCRSQAYNQDYCIACGKDLRDVLGFLNNYYIDDIEINKNFIKTYATDNYYHAPGYLPMPFGLNLLFIGSVSMVGRETGYIYPFNKIMGEKRGAKILNYPRNKMKSIIVIPPKFILPGRLIINSIGYKKVFYINKKNQEILENVLSDPAYIDIWNNDPESVKRAMEIEKVTTKTWLSIIVLSAIAIFCIFVVWYILIRPK